MASSFEQILKDLGGDKVDSAPSKVNIPIPSKPDSLNLSIQGSKFIKSKNKNAHTEQEEFLEQPEGPFSAEAAALGKLEAARVVWETKHRGLK